MRRILKKINALIDENRNNQNKIYLQAQEIEWAAVYHDSIRGIKWIEEMPLNIGRWAGNYSFFYVLNRILKDFRPNSILELGLGESTKFISTYLDNYLTNSKHLVIEQDENWKNMFEQNFDISQRTKITICPSEKNEIKGYETNVYQNLDKTVTEEFELYIVDGPKGNHHYSRYDIVKLATNFRPDSQFIIIIDDFNRLGEKETVKDLLSLFKEQKRKIFEQIYEGNKGVKVMATEKYKYVTSL
jgi:hypothetical protein